MSQASGPRLGVLLTILTVAGLTWVGLPNQIASQIAYAVERGKLQAVGDDLARSEEVSGAFRKVAKIARPGVVHIRLAGSEREISGMRERLKQRLGEDFNEERWEQFLRRHPGLGSGSGIIIDEQGHILTNNHVVREQTGIKVTLNDDREFEARLVGSDPKSDLAVIRIDAPQLSPLRFGDSDALEVGDWVLAVGAPFGLKHTVTHGIVSAIGRSDIVTGRENILYQNFIQTDAAINPGNSGGPLLNLRGEVVGVNTAIAADEDGRNAGVAFTIPSSLARRVAEQLINAGRVARGWLGVSLGEVDPDLAQALELPKAHGALVDMLYEGGPGAQAGLQCEDVIVAAGARPVDGIRALQSAIADVAPGQAVTLRIIRDGKERTIDVPVGKQPEDIDTFARTAKAITSRTIEPLKMGVRTMRAELPGVLRMQRGSAALAETAFQLATRHGAFVVSAPGADLRAGEMVVAVNEQPVRSVAGLARLIAADDSRAPLKLRVMSADASERVISVRRE